MNYRKLVVISHTPHHLDRYGRLTGWGPTVRELDEISSKWSEVVHVGVLYPGFPDPSELTYTANNIRFSAIPPTGGKSWLQKLSIIWASLGILRTLKKELKDASHVQLRVPMGFGIYLIPWFAFQAKRNFILWIKYANNWVSPSVPPGYRLQRWMLKRNWARCPVTINGQWPDQPKHCLSFENPCLTDRELDFGHYILESKVFDGPYNLVFIGRLDMPKGVPDLINALHEIPEKKVACVHIVGDGPLKAQLQALQKQVDYPIQFHSWLAGKDVHAVFQNAHFLLLPSRSEGFPKVIAEAGCYGCIPVCSDVGSIPHYINSEYGFVWRIKDSDSYGEVLTRALNTTSLELRSKSMKCHSLATKFTFGKYLNDLETRVFKGFTP